MDKNNILIDLKKISFSYPKGKAVLSDVDFTLYKNDKIGLMGSNGSGKTTLFHIIMGLIKPTKGRVKLFGREMKKEEDFRQVRQKVGLLFQDADDQLFCPTVLEDVAFGPLNQGKSVKSAREIAQETLASLGLEEIRDRVTYKLSGGEKKLVSLATVLAMKPRVLLLDEPTNGLDEEVSLMMTGVLQRIDMPYIFISHDMDFIRRTTNKIYGIADGNLLYRGEEIPHTHVHLHDYGQLPHVHSHEEKH